jgi:hypothetical protein
MAMLKVFLHGLVQMFISLDQFLNVWLWPFSMNTWADETFSSRCGRLQHRKPYVWFAFIANVLFYWQAWDMNHCKRAYEKENLRRQSPPEMRNKYHLEGEE